MAVQEGHEQIVQILLEKGKPNVNLATEVFLLIVDCFFFFLTSLSQRKTVIHYAAYRWESKILEHLLKSQFAKLDQDKLGNQTELACALEMEPKNDQQIERRNRVISILLAAGSMPSKVCVFLSFLTFLFSLFD